MAERLFSASLSFSMCRCVSLWAVTQVRGNSGGPESAEGRAARVADRVSAIVDPAKATFLEKLGLSP